MKTYVLDGQQRLQTLFALFNGTINDAEGKSQLEAYIDITAGDTRDFGGLERSGLRQRARSIIHAGSPAPIARAIAAG